MSDFSWSHFALSLSCPRISSVCLLSTLFALSSRSLSFVAIDSLSLSYYDWYSLIFLSLSCLTRSNSSSSRSVFSRAFSNFIARLVYSCYYERPDTSSLSERILFSLSNYFILYWYSCIAWVIFSCWSLNLWLNLASCCISNLFYVSSDRFFPSFCYLWSYSTVC